MNKIKEVKARAEKITKQKVSVQTNSGYLTISRKDSTTDNSFGYYEAELRSVFNIIRLDGCSFDIKI